jgi:ribokinase
VSTVAVLGSANLDMVVSAPRRPSGGETLMGKSYLEAPGGKGLNQALAASRVGPTSFVGAVGSDDAASTLLGALADARVDTSHVRRTVDLTGRAIITLTPDAENSIIVLPLANSGVSKEHLVAALEELRPTVVLSQFEIPISAVEGAARWARATRTRFVLNPSPVAAFAPDLLAEADPLIVNEVEAQQLTEQIITGALLAEAAASLARSVVLTLGARGALVVDDSGVHAIPAERVVAQDSTGAGDAFAGTLAAHLAQGRSLVQAAQFASRAGALVVQRHRADR